MSRTLLGALAASAILLLSSPAGAFEFYCRGYTITGYSDVTGCPTGARDTDSCGCEPTRPETAPTWFNGQLSLAVENQGGSGITAAQFVAATRNAAKSWTDVSCSNLAMSASATLAANAEARFGTTQSEHGVFFIASESEWMEQVGGGSGGTLGVTMARYSEPSCGEREFYDSDVAINGDIAWTPTEVEQTLLHELGHAIGLGHPCLYGTTRTDCSNACQAVMGASGGEYTTPQQDDINGVCALYPGTPGGLGSQCTSNAQCTSGPCIDYQGFKYCSKTCGTCDTGYRCTSVSGQNVCTRQGAPGIGEACTSACEPGATCIGQGDGSGICRKECTPGSTGGCVGADRCVALQDGGGVCWPPGSLQVGELCGSSATGDCAPGLACLEDGGTDAAPIAHCYRECDENSPTSCGSDQRCVDIGDMTGICFAAAREGGDCSDTGVCVAGLMCAPKMTGSGFTCRKSCDYDDLVSCQGDHLCVTLVDQSDRPLGGACYPVGHGLEGERCSGTLDCAGGLVCQTQGSTAKCKALCDTASDCPHSGQTCDRVDGLSRGVCSPAGGGTPGTTDPTDQPDPGNTPDGSVRECACDVSYACDPDCAACDPECKETKKGCAAHGRAGAGDAWGVLVMLALEVARRRRRVKKLH